MQFGYIVQLRQIELMQIQHNIGVTVKTDYVRNQSDPDNARYVFAYTITIKNNGTTPAQLLRRRWLITDANDKIQEDEKQPSSSL